MHKIKNTSLEDICFSRYLFLLIFSGKFREIEKYSIKERYKLMFREMRRKKQLLSKEETVKVLKRCTNGIMACLGDDDYPYAVPFNYVYHNDRIYFHSAKSGHKVDAIIKNPKVSFAVVDKDKIVSEEYTSYFSSVIAFGKARIVEGDEWNDSFMALVEKYSGDMPHGAKHSKVEGCTESLIVAIDVEYITGKVASELLDKKDKK